jgi:hypothetical protein
MVKKPTLDKIKGIENRLKQMREDPRTNDYEYKGRLSRFYETFDETVWGQILCKMWLAKCYKQSRDYKTNKERIEAIDKYEKAVEKIFTRWETHITRGHYTSGYIYILGNPGMPGVFKIGQTHEQTPRVRANQLYSEGKTAVPARFSVEYERETFDCLDLEKYLFEELWDARVSFDKEFFKMELGRLKDTVDELISEYELSQYKYFNTRKI